MNLKAYAAGLCIAVIAATAFAVPADHCPLWARLGLAVYNRFYVYMRHCAYGFFFFVKRHLTPPASRRF